ncbi:hypothetical protein CPT_Magia_058 [Burkholderia phage Magia]|uniref:Uncharacterized protein n=1 Tax=Burkholderia phage Magia TaxID=2767577 RepID=A0A873WBS7_9CAUD|nr:hypothetical protein PQC04_gp58 [Burkholderia phage Magia]QPB08739.1 hypothetical protein CPT_Magia_058 [Burkholderia phage Magia]
MLQQLSPVAPLRTNRHRSELLSLARSATPGRAGSGPREVCADYQAIGHVLLAVLHQVRSSLQAVAKLRPSALRLS